MLIFFGIFIAIGQSFVIFPQNSEFIYKNSVLDNGLEYLIIQCQHCQKSGFSISINVGSNSDSIEGLSHLLEHMIFYSSKTYPKEDYLLEFITLNSGYSNAYTEAELTNFFFSIDNGALENAVKIISKAVFEPIFSENSVKREILAVDSEHKKNIFNDDWRNFRVLQIALINHPFGKFGTGNLDTLNVKNIEKIVENHFREHYFAKNMKIVLYSNYSIDVIEEILEKNFEDIPSGMRFKEKKKVNVEENKLFVIEKISEGINLNVYWIIPSQIYFPKTFPGIFIAYLLNNQGENGIKGLFPQIKSFRIDVEASFSDFSILHAEIYLFSIENFQEIISTIYESIEKLKNYSENKLKVLWQDFFQIKLNDFKFFHIIDPETLASSISANMHYFESNYYYSGFNLIYDYNYKEIQNLIEILLNSKFISILSLHNSMNYNEINGKTLHFDSFCKFYNMEYAEFDINLTKSNKKIEFFSQNSLIPKDLQVLEGNSEIKQFFSSKNLEIWHKFNSNFKTPKVFITLLLIPQTWSDSQIEIEILFQIYELMISEKLFLYKIAGFDAEYELNYRGIIIKIKGWNEKILDFLEEVLKIMSEWNPNYFIKSYNSLYEKYSQHAKKQPYIKSSEYFEKFLITNFLSSAEKLKILAGFTNSNMLDSNKVFNSYLKVLVYGNFYVESLDFLCKILSNTFFFSNISNSPQFTPIASSISLNYKSFDNNCVVNFYDFGNFTSKTFSHLLIISKLANENAFRVLRTQEQLGYIVYVTLSSDYLTNILKIVVQGYTFSPEYIQSRVENFWNNFKIDVKVMNELKNQTIKEMTWPAENLEDENLETWKEILKGRYNFNIKTEIIKEIELITYEGIENILGIIRDMKTVVKINISKEPEQELFVDQSYL